MKKPSPSLEKNPASADDSTVGLPVGVALDILIIDDSTFIRAFTRIHLQDAGYAVEEVEPVSLFKVLGAIHTYRPRLIITDYEMPFCNGETLVRAIREDTEIKHIPILVLSAHREAELVGRLTQWNLAGYAVKPIRPEDLIATVRRCLPLPAPVVDPEPEP
ncbi:MAG: response regulator [Holophaga sp.]|nr:response regulator [Holophaga sp.]